MLRSTLSVLGLYNYRPDIFDKFHVPEGVDKDILEPELLAEVAELESLYTDPDILKDLIGAWSNRRLYAWTKLYNTTKLEYDPIYNKDAYYEETENRGLTSKSSLSTTQESETERDLASGDDTTHYTYGFNSTTSQAASMDSSSGTETGTVTEESSGTASGTGSEDEKITRKRREYGNIGVTTSQQMIEAEREVADFDIYQYIITDFKHRFCVLVY